MGISSDSSLHCQSPMSRASCWSSNASSFRRRSLLPLPMKSIVSAGLPRVRFPTLLRSGYGVLLSRVHFFVSAVRLDQASGEGLVCVQSRLRGAEFGLFRVFLSAPFGPESWIPPMGVRVCPLVSRTVVPPPVGCGGGSAPSRGVARLKLLAVRPLARGSDSCMVCGGVGGSAPSRWTSPTEWQPRWCGLPLHERIGTSQQPPPDHSKSKNPQGLGSPTGRPTAVGPADRSTSTKAHLSQPPPSLIPTVAPALRARCPASFG